MDIRQRKNKKHKILENVLTIYDFGDNVGIGYGHDLIC